MGAQDFLLWLQSSWFSTAIKSSSGLYPVINTLHVLSIGLIVGSLTALDLRFLGFARDISLQAAERFLRKIAVFGLLIAVPTGVLLLLTEAVTLFSNRAFLIKMALLVIALLNAATFIALWRKKLSNDRVGIPFFAQTQAALSLILWIAIASLGRFIAYV